MGRVLAVAVVGVLLFFAYRYAVHEGGADIERQVLNGETPRQRVRTSERRRGRGAASERRGSLREMEAG